MTDTAANSNRYLFVITGFDTEPDRTAGPLVLANAAVAAGSDVLVWLTHEAVKLAIGNNADSITPKSFPSLGQLLKNYREAGGRIGICPPCGKTHGVTEENMLANAGWMGAAALVNEMQGRQTLSF